MAAIEVVEPAPLGGRMVDIAVNGETRHLDVPTEMPLLWALRDVIGLTGTKFSCGAGL